MITPKNKHLELMHSWEMMIVKIQQVCPYAVVQPKVYQMMVAVVLISSVDPPHVWTKIEGLVARLQIVSSQCPSHLARVQTCLVSL